MNPPTPHTIPENPTQAGDFFRKAAEIETDAPITAGECMYPLAEQTAVAADCIRECGNYLDKLKDFYISAVEVNQENYLNNGIDGDSTDKLLDCVTALTNSIAKIIDRLSVGGVAK